MSVRVVKKTIDGGDSLKKIFNQMVGIDAPDPDIAIPKCTKARTAIYNIIRTLRVMTEPKIRKYFPEAKAGFDEIAIYIEQLYFNLRFAEEKTVDEKNVQKLYKEIKDNFCKKLINTGAALVNHTEELKKGDYQFILDAGEFKPFTFAPTFNMYEMFVADLPNVHKYLIDVLVRIQQEVNIYYQVLRSPDINAKELGVMLTQHVTELKSQVPRCDDAFNMINQSIGLFEENFTGYYKDFITTENPGIILENYIADVSKKANTKPKVMLQFRHIIQKLKSQRSAAMHSSDPHLKEMFAKLESGMDAISNGKENKTD